MYAWHKTIFTAACDDEPRQALEALSDWFAWDDKLSRPVVGSCNGVLVVARPNKYTVIYPFSLDELELATKMRPDKYEN